MIDEFFSTILQQWSAQDSKQARRNLVNHPAKLVFTCLASVGQLLSVWPVLASVSAQIAEPAVPEGLAENLEDAEIGQHPPGH